MATDQQANQAPLVGEEYEDRPAEIVPLTAIDAITRSEIDIQIATAKRFPRSIAAFLQQAREMATLDEETAASMFYVLPRAGKKIEGPSVRLAEIVGSAWGNLRYGARVVEIGATHVTAQGACFDLEKNIAANIEVRRRITNKDGRRYNDDMIGTTCNAAASIALRQAIFKVIPFTYVKAIYEDARTISIGKALTMEQRRARAFEWFAKLGVSEAQVLTMLEQKGIEDVTTEDLIVLTGLRTAIKDGETTVAEAFAADGAMASGLAPTGSKAEQVLARIRKPNGPAAKAEVKEEAAKTEEVMARVEGAPATIHVPETKLVGVSMVERPDPAPLSAPAGHEGTPDQLKKFWAIVNEMGLASEDRADGTFVLLPPEVMEAIGRGPETGKPLRPKAFTRAQMSRAIEALVALTAKAAEK
jgi:hypothetical protein